MQYNSKTAQYYIVSYPQTATSTQPTVNKTIAVDPYYVPRLSSGRAKVDIENVGTRQAEDGGDLITGFHIDVFYGVGKPSPEPSWNISNQKVAYYGNNLW